MDDRRWIDRLSDWAAAGMALPEWLNDLRWSLAFALMIVFVLIVWWVAI